MVLGASGRVYTWGYGAHGQLGHGDIKDYAVPKEVAHFSARKLRVALISAGYLHSGAITDCDSPSVLLWGANPDHRLM